MQLSGVKGPNINAIECAVSAQLNSITCGISQIFLNVSATRPIRVTKSLNEKFYENA